MFSYLQKNLKLSFLGMLIAFSFISSSFAVVMCSLDEDGDGWGSDTQNILSFTNNDIANDSGANTYISLAEDFDGDGDRDIYAIEASSRQNKLWINDGTAEFTANNIALDTGSSFWAVAWDVDGDDDLDIYVVDSFQNKLWINDGSGDFTPNHIAGDTSWNTHAMMGDVDGDDDLDIYTTLFWEQSKLWINDGTGEFTWNHISGNNGNGNFAIFFDVDGDDDLDIYIAADGQDTLWMNDGTGEFTNNDIAVDALYWRYAITWDVDGDDDLDLYVANDWQNKLWINGGTGEFTNNDITGDGGADSRHALFFDADGDDDLDIYVSNYGSQNKLWINDGSGEFTNNDIAGDTGFTSFATAEDIDLDGDVDLYAGNSTQNRLWLNDGSGEFVNADIALDTGNTSHIIMADLDGDNDLDIYNSLFGSANHKLWINDEAGVCTDLGSGWEEMSSLDGTGDTNDSDPAVYPWAPVQGGGNSSSIDDEDQEDDDDNDDNDSDDDNDNDEEDEDDTDEEDDDDNDDSQEDDDDNDDNDNQTEDICTTDLILRMHSEGLTKFDNEEEFRPRALITRGEAAKFVSKFGEIVGLHNSYWMCEFTDIAGYDDTLTPYIQQACNLGLLKGSEGKFMPWGNLTTAQSLTIIVRALYGFQDETTPYRYENYVNMAYSLGIETNLSMEEIGVNNITRRDFGRQLCHAAHVANAQRNQ